MRAFIYTGGTVYTEHVEERPTSEDLVIAADSGYRTVQKMGITPQILVGDFDSLGEPQAPKECEILRVPAEKNSTDTHLAVDIAIERGAREIVIVGGLEGRLDHTLSTVAILEQLNERRVHAVVTNGKSRVRFLRNNGTILGRGAYRYFSIVAADPVVRGVTVEGGKYPLKNAKLKRTFQYAVSNESVGNCALIEIRRGGVWVIESMD
ncbi:MAG: thiamine diphosphokinase [Clostridia bacterium]|nr:thiamine diphosphokinase [Clostridia bacterium]